MFAGGRISWVGFISNLCSAKRSSVVFLFGEASSLRRVGSEAPALLESGSFPSSRDVGKEPYAELNNAGERYGGTEKMIVFKLKYLIVLIILSTINSCSGQSLEIVTVATDNVNEGIYYLNHKGLVVEFIYHDELCTKRDTFFYSYSDTDLVEKIRYLSGGVKDGFDENVEKKYINDAVFQNNYLLKKGIVFPLPFVNNAELGDMVKVFSCCDKYQEITAETEKIFIFTNINKKISFRSNIDKYIQHLTIIKKYQVILKENFLVKEEFTFDGGVLTRIYHYDKTHKLSSITWDCVYDDDSNKYTETKTFSWECR